MVPTRTVITPEIVAADKAIIAAARAANIEEVARGSAEYEVLMRWGGDEVHDHDDPALLAKYLLHFTHPALPFATDCPFWCDDAATPVSARREHADDLLSIDHETSVTNHTKRIETGGEYSIWITREDRRTDGIVTIGTPTIEIGADGIEWSAESAIAFAIEVRVAASTLRNITDTEATIASQLEAVDAGDLEAIQVTNLILTPDNLEMVMHLDDTRRKRFGYITAEDCDDIAAWVSHQVDHDMWASVARQLREAGHPTIDAAFIAGTFRAEA